MGARRPSGDGGSHDIDRLIIDTFESGRELTAEELRAIREHVVQRGFNPDVTEVAGGRAAGGEWNGSVVKASDRIPPFAAHWLRHRDEWPSGLTLDGYSDAVERTVLSSGPVVIHEFNGIWVQLAFLSPMDDAGRPWMLVEYRPSFRHITTAFRVSSPEREFAAQERMGARWLNPPS